LPVGGVVQAKFEGWGILIAGGENKKAKKRSTSRNLGGREKEGAAGQGTITKKAAVADFRSTPRERGKRGTYQQEEGWGWNRQAVKKKKTVP